MDLAATRLLDIASAVLVGAVLGAIFFGGLWLTVQRAAERRLALFAGSFVLRSAILLVGLWWVGRGDPARLLACLAATIAMRSLVLRACVPPASSARHRVTEEDAA